MSDMYGCCRVQLNFTEQFISRLILSIFAWQYLATVTMCMFQSPVYFSSVHSFISDSHFLRNTVPLCRYALQCSFTTSLLSYGAMQVSMYLDIDLLYDLLPSRSSQCNICLEMKLLFLLYDSPLSLILTLIFWCIYRPEGERVAKRILEQWFLTWCPWASRGSMEGFFVGP